MAKRIMAVDDSRTMREMVVFTLEQAGYAVSSAEDGVQAIEALRTEAADLIITDLNMPNMDGVTLIRTLRQDPKWRSTPILMLTTESAPSRKAAGREAGATGWIVKPFDPVKLIDVVRRVAG